MAGTFRGEDLTGAALVGCTLLIAWECSGANLAVLADTSIVEELSSIALISDAASSKGVSSEVSCALLAFTVSKVDVGGIWASVDACPSEGIWSVICITWSADSALINDFIWACAYIREASVTVG